MNTSAGFQAVSQDWQFWQRGWTGHLQGLENQAGTPHRQLSLGMTEKQEEEPGLRAAPSCSLGTMGAQQGGTEIISSEPLR